MNIVLEEACVHIVFNGY